MARRPGRQAKGLTDTPEADERGPRHILSSEKRPTESRGDPPRLRMILRTVAAVAALALLVEGALYLKRMPKRGARPAAPATSSAGAPAAPAAQQPVPGLDVDLLTATYVGSIGAGPGSGPGNMNMPCGLAFGPDGALYVADQMNYRIQKFRADGKFEKEWPCRGGDGAIAGPVGLCWTKAGHLVAIAQGGAIERFDATGKRLARWEKAFFSAAAIAELPSGELLMCDQNVVSRCTPDGKTCSTFGKKGTAPGQYSAPYYVRVGANGNVFVVDKQPGGKLIEYTVGGDFVREFVIPKGTPGELRSVTFDRKGMIYVSTLNAGILLVLDAKLRLRGAIRQAGDVVFGSCNDVATDAKGDLYVSDIAANKIVKFKPPA